MIASSVGLGDATERLDVMPGVEQRRDFRLGAEVVQLGKFVVEGTREGQARALTQQKNAINLMTVVSSDAVGKFRDAYVGDALRRLVGVVVEEDQGEATGVTIRGIEPDYNNITINGVEVAATGTPGGGTSNLASRPVPLDIFSVDVIESIEVAKATTPDMDGGGLGGAVNVKTKTAFTRGGRELTASGEYTHADLGNGSDGYRGTLSYSNIFGSDRNFGALVSATREQRDRIVEKVYGTQYNSAGILQRSRANGYTQTLTRTSLMANFDYRVTASTTASLKTTYSDYDDESGYDRAQIHADQGRYQNEYVRDHRYKKLYSADLSAETRFGRSLLRVGGIYSYSDEDKPENQKHVFRTANNAVQLTFDQSDWISPSPRAPGRRWHSRSRPGIPAMSTSPSRRGVSTVVLPEVIRAAGSRAGATAARQTTNTGGPASALTSSADTRSTAAGPSRRASSISPMIRRSSTPTRTV